MILNKYNIRKKVSNYLLLLAALNPAKSIEPISYAQKIFEEAQTIQKENPDLAIVKYKKLLSLPRKRINPKIKKAARWNMIFAYYDAKRYAELLTTLNFVRKSKSGKKVYEKFQKNIETHTALSNSDQLIWINALKNLDIPQLELFFNHYPHIIHASCKYLDKKNQCETVFLRIKKSPNINLYMAEQCLIKNKTEEFPIYIEQYEKNRHDDTMLNPQYYYLKGKFALKKNDPEVAIENFEMAIDQTKSIKEKNYYKAILALQYYKLNDYDTANRLLSSREINQQIGKNEVLLNALVQCKKGSCQALKELWLKKNKNGYSNFLMIEMQKMMIKK